MGERFVDKYSLLHFASGIIAYFFGIPLLIWILLHISFEILENRNDSIYFIDKYLFFWPGGKKFADSTINSIGDTFFAVAGWLFADWISKFDN